VDPLTALFGLGVGLLVGMTGVGGGSLMTPLLIIVFGVKPVTAVGTDLTYAAVTKTVGGYKHWRQRTVDAGISVWMAFGSVPAAIGGTYVLHALERAYGGDFDSVMLTTLAAALLFTGTATLARALFMHGLDESERDTVPLTTRNRIAAVVIGVFVGFILGMTSAGSGAFIAVALVLVFRLVPTRVVGTDVFHAAILLWAAAAHIMAGNVDFGLAGTLLIGSVPGVWIGSQWSLGISGDTLRVALGIVLVGSGLGLLSKAGTHVPAAVLAAVPVLLAVLVGGQALRPRRAGRAESGAPSFARRLRGRGQRV
jgi:uncharacterized membrane protein YfcA